MTGVKKRTRRSSKPILSKPKIVYIVGAGFSAGIGFPTISNLLKKIWERLVRNDCSDEIAAIIRFHHPEFNSSIPDTFINVEQLLSEMRANEQLFDFSRPVTGKFTIDELTERRQRFLLEIATWFHEIQRSALAKPPFWLQRIVAQMKTEEAQVISFNWDLVLDEMLFGESLSKLSYGFGAKSQGPCLIKPHGSLNWYEHSTGRHLRGEKKFLLSGKGDESVHAFKLYRAPISSRRTYMPLIVPPVFNKEFSGSHFKVLWRRCVEAISTASEVRFLGYSLAEADFHARFILRCGFFNQENGMLLEGGKRSIATGRSRVTVVDLEPQARYRIEKAVGWQSKFFRKSIEEWVESWPS